MDPIMPQEHLKRRLLRLVCVNASTGTLNASTGTWWRSISDMQGQQLPPKIS